MTTRDDYRAVARAIKRDMDSFRFAFKTVHANELMGRLRERGENVHTVLVKKSDKPLFVSFT